MMKCRSIASVFYNRLAIGMKLQTDPTVQYALGYNAAQGTWWTNPLSENDLQFDSPYNTYLYPGLPPGPISNPGLAALKAVANPAQTTYYLFPGTLRRIWPAQLCRNLRAAPAELLPVGAYHYVSEVGVM